jgi:multiple sugar transport system substrate-binding protein
MRQARRTHPVVVAAAMAVGLLAAALPSTAIAQEVTPAPPAEDCAKSDHENAMQMWERSGGNAPMVELLVCGWNAAEPDRPINLVYIPHTEMVAKLAQGLATGDVPDLMGLDLIYGPQFTSAGQLQDITDLISDDPHLATVSPGHLEVAKWEDRIYGLPLYADVSVLFWNKDLFREAGLDPEKPPTSLQEIHDMAAQINDPANGVYGYYLPGNCAGCNIFTFGQLIWASGGTIGAATCDDEPLVGDNIPAVLEWARQMHQDRLIDPAARTENGETFHLVMGSGKVGIFGTGNFNVALLQTQAPDMDIGVTLLPGVEPGSAASFAGGDIVVVPNGSDRLTDAVDFMRWLLTDETQLEIYAKALNMTTRTDLLDNEYLQANEDVADMVPAFSVTQTPFSTTFFEQINSPAGPWLQMLQRVYYNEDPIDTVITDAKAAMTGIACSV